MNDLEVGVVVTAKVGSAVRNVGKATKTMRTETARVARTQEELARAGDRAERSTGRLGRSLASAGRRAAGMARNAAGAVRQLKAVRGVASSAGRALDKVGNRYSALITGAGAIGAVRFIGNLQERFTRIGIQAGLSAEEVGRLKREIYDVARQKNIRIDPGELTAGIEKILAKMGDLDLARANIESIALVIQAAGAAGADAGAMIADMAEKFDIKDPVRMREMLDTLVVQGKAGAFELGDLASQGERVTAAYAGMGRTGPVAVREMGSLLQMARKGVGSAEEAATAFENLMKGIVENSKELEGMGVTIWDEEKLAEGVKVARSAIDIVKDLVTETEGDIERLTEIFDVRAMRALTVLKTEFSNTGDFATLDSFMKVMGDGTQIMEDSARAAKTANAAMRNLLTAWQIFADTRLTGPIESLTELLDKLSTDELDGLISTVATGAGVLGAAVIGRKVFKAGAALRGMFGKGGRSAGIGGAALAAAGGGPMPVIVTNWPAGGLGGMGTGGGKRKGRAASRGRAGAAAGGVKGLGASLMAKLPKMPAGMGSALKGVGKVLGKVAMPVMVGMSLIDTVGAVLKGDAKEVGGSLGNLGGTLGGAAAGAALGSVVPVIGTAIGGLIGALAGGLGGETLGGWIGSLFSSEKKKAESPDRKETTAVPEHLSAASVAAAATAPSVPANNNTVHLSITVNATPDQDAEEIAEKVMEIAKRETRRNIHE